MIRHSRDHVRSNTQPSAHFSNAKQPRKTALWIGLAAGLTALALAAARTRRQPQRRYADLDQERRNPQHFFLAGGYPRRRRIDRSGARPLFERRQSVYDSY